MKKFLTVTEVETARNLQVAEPWVYKNPEHYLHTHSCSASVGKKDGDKVITLHLLFDGDFIKDANPEHVYLYSEDS